jgi:hypothetical protein
MRKLLIPLLLLLLVIPALSQDKPSSIPFRTLQISGTALTWCDFTFTTWALKTGTYAEANPIARFYVKHTGIAIPIILATDIFINWGLSSIYEDNKPLAWGMLIVFTAARAYIMYHNFKVVTK